MISREDWYQSPVFSDPVDFTGKFLYHFTSIERLASIALLGQLLASPLSVQNDPRETLMENPNITHRWDFADQARSSFDEAEIANYHLARKKVRVISFSSDQKPKGVDAFHRRDARAYANSAMWAHYARLHGGVCLVLNRENLENDLKGKGWDKGWVTYFHGVNPVSLAAGRAHGPGVGIEEGTWREHLKTSLFTKNAHWSYENEYRLISSTSDGVEIITSAAAVVVGSSFQPHLLPVVAAVAEELNLAPERLAQVTIGHDGVLEAFPLERPDGSMQVTAGGRREGFAYFDEEIEMFELTGKRIGEGEDATS